MHQVEARVDDLFGGGLDDILVLRAERLCDYEWSGVALSTNVLRLSSPVGRLEQALVADSLPLKLASEGNLPTGVSYRGKWLPGNLRGDGVDLLVGEANWRQDGLPSAGGGMAGVAKAEITAFELSDAKKVFQYPTRYIETLVDVDAQGIAWTVGDSDRDGLDEILICEGEVLLKHEWSDDSFAVDTLHLPGTGHVDQILVGNLDDEQGNELIALSLGLGALPDYTDETGSVLGAVSYALTLWREKGGDLHQVWGDSAGLGYQSYVVIPPDRLVAVGDFFNEGRNQLVLRRAQSDVSPTEYDFLVWGRTGLNPVRRVVLSNGRVWNQEDYWTYQPRDDTYPEKQGPAEFIVGDIQPVRVNDRTYALAHRFPAEPGVVTNHTIIELSGETYIAAAVSPREALQGDCVLWADPDGKGKGLLSFSGSEWSFYR
jgi:hypothetical protein